MSVIRKFSSLAVLHGTTLLLPLLMYPYLAQKLGPASFGEFAVSQAIIQYFILTVDYGFNLSATRTAAVEAGNKAELGRLFWSVFCAKGVLLALSALLLSMFLLLYPESQLFYLVLLQFPLVIAAWLFPLWLLQGLERLTQASTLSIIARASAVPLVLLLVEDEEDLDHAAFAFGVGGLLLAVFGVVVTRRLALGKSGGFSRADLWLRLHQGWPLFLASAGGSLYSATNIVLLRLVAPGAEVGFFAAAEKLRTAAIGLIPIMTNVLFPASARNAGKHHTSLRQELRNHIPILMVGAFVFVCLLGGAAVFIPLLFGTEMQSAVPVLQIAAFSAMVIPISHIIGIQFFVARGHNRPYAYTLIGAGMANLLLLPCLGYFYQAKGAAVGVLLTEVLIAVSLIGLFYRMAHSHPAAKSVLRSS